MDKEYKLANHIRNTNCHWAYEHMVLRKYILIVIFRPHAVSEPFRQEA